jgi:tyrosyl-tRNA synthetase
MLSGEEIDQNAKTYVSQVGKILLTDPEHLEVRYNGEWLAPMTLVDVIRLAARKSVAQILTRDDFAKRYAENTPIRLHEILYPLLQGWDSVQINADVEMGGSDQLFNNLVGRQFQIEEGKEGQVVIVTPLLVGTDGVNKMSKSKKNYIAVTDPPGGKDGMFGKIMSLPDALMDSYFTLLTDLPESEFRPLIAQRPRDAKIKLAKYVINWLHNAAAADAAEAEFIKVISEKGTPEEMPELRIGAGPHKLAPLMVQAGLVSSNSEAIRKIKEGAVKIDGEKVVDFQKEHHFEKSIVLQLGNRKFVRLLV